MPKCICLYGGQKRVLDSMELELQLSVSYGCGSWESKVGLLQERMYSLTAE